jgi:hypothetical protein
MKVLAGAIAICAVSTGCAAVFKGGYQDVQVVAIPEGSDVRSNGEFIGETPATVKIDRNNPGNFAVSKDGFTEQRLSIQRKADTPWWIWDIATCVVPILLCIPLGVDAISGAWFSYQDTVRVKLEPLPYVPRQPAPTAPARPAPAAPDDNSTHGF